MQEQKLYVTDQRIMRLSHVQNYTGLSKSTIYLRISDGLWPTPVNLGGRAVGWPEREISAINSARIAGKSNDEIKQLVKKLQDDRLISVKAGVL